MENSTSKSDDGNCLDGVVYSNRNSLVGLRSVDGVSENPKIGLERRSEKGNVAFIRDDEATRKSSKRESKGEKVKKEGNKIGGISENDSRVDKNNLKVVHTISSDEAKEKVDVRFTKVDGKAKKERGIRDNDNRIDKDNLSKVVHRISSDEATEKVDGRFTKVNRKTKERKDFVGKGIEHDVGHPTSNSNDRNNNESGGSMGGLPNENKHKRPKKRRLEGVLPMESDAITNADHSANNLGDQLSEKPGIALKRAHASDCSDKDKKKKKKRKTSE